MSSRIIFLLFLLVPLCQLWADDPPNGATTILGRVELENVDEWPVSDIYYRGPFLIYDCASRHFVCVNRSGMDECDELREAARANRQSVLPCAPLAKAESIESCIKLHYELIHRKVDKGFCLGNY